MSNCSFISDEGINSSENQSFLEFSLDTSHIKEVSDRSSFSANAFGCNLKKLQTLLFQTNFFLKKLEEKMNETQRSFDTEVSIRQLRSHQTVLSLKINSDNIDDSFMMFVSQKHTKLLNEVKKVLESVSDATSTSQFVRDSRTQANEFSPQSTPAFSSNKNFDFKVADSVDVEVASKITEVFTAFYKTGSDQRSYAILAEGFFKVKYPSVCETLIKAIRSLEMLKQRLKNDQITQGRAKIAQKFNEDVEDSRIDEKVGKVLALKELHLNLDLMKKRNEKRQTSCSFTQTCERSEISGAEQKKKTQALEAQLTKLMETIRVMNLEKVSIEKCQEQLIQRIGKTKSHDQESTEFFRERFENTNKILLNLQENYSRVMKRNEELATNIDNRGLHQKILMENIHRCRYELSLLIKDLEEFKLSITPEQLNGYISNLHKISLMLIFDSFEPAAEMTKPISLTIEKRLESASQRSKSSVKSATERLDQYLKFH